MSKRRLAKSDYTVGWVCALPHEMAAAICMLDEIHEDLEEQDISDHNSYQLGRIHHHDIAIASLPAGVYGTTTAATVAKDMLRTFPSIRFGLMVGIGGGAPSLNHDIRLGDVVVSEPRGANGGIIQYDRGKMTQAGRFQRTGSLNSPPMILLTTLGRLKAIHQFSSNKIPLFLSQVSEKYAKFKAEYAFPGRSHDQLFQAAYEHPKSNVTCEMCDPEAQVHREPRRDTDPHIHYGNIASSNQVMKDGVTRDQLCEELDVLCFEMEAAGLMPDFPCLVIRGICDYSDSHKNKIWQKYAAAVAAGFARELLELLSADRVRHEKLIVEVSDPVLQEITSNINIQLRSNAERQESLSEIDKHRECHHALKTSVYEQFKNNNPDRVPNTCRWVLENDKYTQWWQGQNHDLLWISADPGCGKSVMVRSLIENELRGTSTHTICYFFFKDNEEQENLTTALCAILHQLFDAQPQLLRHAMPSWNKNGQKLTSEVYELWRILIAAVQSKDANRVTIVMDALDECCEKDRHTLIGLLPTFRGESLQPSSQSRSMKFLFTSRPYIEIENDFRRIGLNVSMIRLNGELENDIIHEEINLVIRQKIATLGRNNDLSRSTIERLEQKLLNMEHRTYLWLHLTIGEIENVFQKSLQPDLELIESSLLPTSVEDAYEKILTRIPKDQKKLVAQIFHIIIGARRPLTISEMSMALSIHRRKGLELFAKFKIADGRLHRKIRDLCGFFIFINHLKIYFIHQTAKEFLLQERFEPMTGCWRHSLNPSESENIMTRICVEYLSLSKIYDSKIVDIKLFQKDGIDDESDDDGARLAEMIEEHEIGTLLLYSTEHWAAHFRNTSFKLGDPIVSKVRELCRVQGNKFRLWFPWMWKALRRGTPPAKMNDLMVAAFNGHEVILKMILSAERTALEAQDGNGRTALIWASSEGHERVVKILLNMGADINAEDHRYRTALKGASMNGHEKVVKLLLIEGADVNGQYDNSGSALTLASEMGHEKVVKMLLDKGANVNAQNDTDGNALRSASAGGHERIVRTLLDKGANINAQDWLIGSALQAASATGQENIVHILLDKGANVNDKGGHYGSALRAASAGGHENIVKKLLKKGAQVNAGKHGSALEAASEKGHVSIVQILINEGADVNAQHRGSNPLLAASTEGRTDVVKILLEHDANVNARGGKLYGYALIAASARGHESTVQILLDHDADVNARGAYNCSALQMASAAGHENIVKSLLRKGADVNARAGVFGTALNAASERNHESIVKILLNNGADVHARDIESYGTALNAAACHKHENIVKILLSHGAKWD